MRICVAVAQYSVTGVPLAQLRLARAWTRAGHRVDFLVGYVPPELTLPDTGGLDVVVLDKPKARQLLWPIARYLKREQPDIVFSAEDHLNGVMLLAAILSGSKAKISGSSRVPPKDSYSNTPFTKGWARKLMAGAVAWRADALTCVSKDMVTSYRHYFPRGRQVAVYNIIDDAAARDKARAPVDHPWFVARDVPLVVSAGTLTGRKNFRLLVAAVGELHRRGRRVRLAIFGEGYRRPELEVQAVELGIADDLWLPGREANVLRYFSRADVLVLSSYAEGLPNVLVEGMICGCTVVATDCPTGPRELLHDGAAGYLVPMDDVAAMADAIERALATPAPGSALEAAVKPFREETVLARHLEVLGLKSAA